MTDIARFVGDAWEKTLRENPDPFESDFRFFGPQRTYREAITRLRRNSYGELIGRGLVSIYPFYLLGQGGMAYANA
jgi:hypothetical protein